MAKQILMSNRIAENRITAEIHKIRWDRFYLHIVLTLTGEVLSLDPLEYYLVTQFHRANAAFEVIRQEGREVELFLDITNPGYQLALPTGIYSLLICRGEEVLAQASVAKELVPTLEDCSGYFRHNLFNIYSVQVRLEEREDGMYPLFDVWDANQAGMRMFNQNPEMASRETLFGKLANLFGRVGKKAVQKLAQQAYDLLHALYRHKDRNILFISEQNETLGGNLLCVFERMKERGMEGEYRLFTSNRAIVADRRKYGIGSWISVLAKLAKADLIFTDDHLPMLDWLNLSKETTFVQLWHAGAGYKASGYARWGHVGGPAPFSCHRQYKYAIGESKNVAEFHAECFGMNAENVLVTGMPRIDGYLNAARKEEVTAELHKRYPAAKERKVILFAPTFRGNDKASAVYPYERIDFDALWAYANEKRALVLFKMHPWIAAPVPIPEEKRDLLIDVSDYPSINDLFYITDVLITDYSSSVMEYALMNRPALFYAFDLFEYSFVRGFHRDYKSSIPGKLCENFDELLAALRNGDYEFEKMAPYLRFHFDHIDEGATDRVIDWIVRGEIPGEVKEKMRARKAQNDRLKEMDFSAVGRPS